MATSNQNNQNHSIDWQHCSDQLFMVTSKIQNSTESYVYGYGSGYGYVKSDQMYMFS